MSGFPALEDLRAGGKRLLARVLTRIETHARELETAEFLDGVCAVSGGAVLGLTGPPGVGKSSLTDALIKAYRSAGKSVAVLAIDPSSSVTGGALLGDRTRLKTDPLDDAVFVRSMAARDRLGGLSDHSVAAIAVLRAVCDHVILETVGIGQSEGDLRKVADTVVLCIQPGSGDSLQFMKAGIMELPDVVAVTKADMGVLARRAASDVTGALSLGTVSLGTTPGSAWKVPVIEVSSHTDSGVPDLVARGADHFAMLVETGLAEIRQRQHVEWFKDMVRTEFGAAGLGLAEGDAGAGWLERARLRPFTSFHCFASGIRQRLR